MARALFLRIRLGGETAAPSSVPRVRHAGRLDRQPLPSMWREPNFFHGRDEPLALEVPAIAIARHLFGARRLLHCLRYQPAALSTLRISDFPTGRRFERAIWNRLHSFPNSP